MAIINRLSRTISYTERWPNDELGNQTEELINISWNNYNTHFQEVSNNCTPDLLAIFLWEIFLWAKMEDPLNKFTYISKAVDSVVLVKILNKSSLLRSLLKELIDTENPQHSLKNIKKTFKDVDISPEASANLVFEFIYAIRDISSDSAITNAFLKVSK
jgi:hypothetical protein